MAARLPGSERAARAATGMPARRPERITRRPSRAQARLLRALAAELWPRGEYVGIITDTRREDR
jgi:hypothetical protein